MIPRVAVTGTGPTEKTYKDCPSPGFLRKLVALVLFLLPVGALVAQEPDPWPPDDDYAAPPPSQPQYSQPPNYSYGQVPQQGTYGQAYPQQPGYAPQPGYGEAQGPMPAQGLNAQQLEQMVAPIALYPDSLIAQILAAATYPAQVAAADQWVRSMGGAPPEQIAEGANAQGWDPSVKALTAYPQVLAMMNQNLQWTTAIGNAYYNQPQDVMETIQVLRQRAQGAGNLQSTPQEQVTADQGYIAVAPANPEVVYVPTYNPWVVYGQPIAAYPGYEPIDTVGAIVGTAVQFGLQFAMGAFLHTPFGLLSWGLDWFGHSILFGHDVWCSHSASVRDWGFPHGGPRAFRGGDWAHGGYGGGYGRGGYGNYGRGGNGGYAGGGVNAFRNEPGINRGGGRYPVARPAQGYENRYQGGYNRGGNYPVARPGQGGEGGPGRGFVGSNGGPGRGYLGSPGPTHPAMPGGQQYAYNRSPMPIGRPQPYQGNPQMYGNRGGQSYGYSRPPQVSNYGQHSAFGSGSYPRPTSGFGGQSYRAPSEAGRAPTPSFGHGFSPPSGNAYAGNSGHSGGFHPFGGGHNSAPSYGGGHSFSGGGGHSFFGGGHSSGGSSHSFGGGGHSFGGGGHSGGGHSGGGGHGHHH